MPFDLKGHRAARSHIATTMLQRLEDDAKVHAEQANSGSCVGCRDDAKCVGDATR